MKSLRKSALWVCGALLLTFGTLARQAPPQAPSPQPSQRPATPAQAPRQSPDPPMNDAQAKISVNSSLVILPVTVKDRVGGEIVYDLQREDFRVFEDNIEQTIDVFTAEAFPLSMVILIDNDLKDKDAEKVQASLEAIVGGLSADDEAWVCRFDQFFHPGKGFTRDPDKLVTELKRTNLDTEPSVGTPGGPFNGPTINNHSVIDDSAVSPSTEIIKGQPTKALDDAVYAAAGLLRDRPRSRRKVILLISDGVNGGRKFNKMTYDSVIKTLLHDNISVYSVAVPSAYLERKLSPIDRVNSPLIRYANDSGGEIYHATKEESLEEFYARMAEEARHEYTLAYVPRGTDRNSDYHTIEVRVKRPKVDVRTREGYYTGEIPTAKSP